MSFAYPGKTNAFSLMQWGSEMLLLKMYEFYLDVDRLTKSFQEKIIYTEVVEVQKRGGKYHLTTTDTVYEADSVVMATEPWVTRKLVRLHAKAPDLISSYVRHVIGIPSSYIQSPQFTFIMFPSKSGMISIGKQADGTYLVYSDAKDVSLDDYFDAYEVIHERAWQPAFFSSSQELIEAEHDQGMYLIGGLNIEGLEDCATTGIWAARQILKSR